MNQILVTEKLYVTPELKKKKKMYKINFILSLIIIVLIVSIYFYIDYKRNKSAQVSEHGTHGAGYRSARDEGGCP